MKPVEFPEQNAVFAKNQPQYRQLPALRCDDGYVITRWHLTFTECLKVLFTGTVWISLLTFKQPLQPLLPEVHLPFELKRRRDLA